MEGSPAPSSTEPIKRAREKAAGRVGIFDRAMAVI